MFVLIVLAGVEIIIVRSRKNPGQQSANMEIHPQPGPRRGRGQTCPGSSYEWPRTVRSSAEVGISLTPPNVALHYKS